MSKGLPPSTRITVEVGAADAATTFEFDPHRITVEVATDIRPHIDRAIRALRMAGDTCDALIEIGRARRVREHMEELDK